MYKFILNDVYNYKQIDVFTNKTLTISLKTIDKNYIRKINIIRSFYISCLHTILKLIL